MSIGQAGGGHTIEATHTHIHTHTQIEREIERERKREREREREKLVCTYAIFEVVGAPKFAHKFAEAEHEGRRAGAVVARRQEKVSQRFDMAQSLRFDF